MQAHTGTRINRQKILDILEIAKYSPSSHNTQPWTVRLEGDSRLIISYDHNRQLKIGDPEKRELFISLGCFVESVIRAAADQSLKASFKYKNENGSVGLIDFSTFENSRTSWQKVILRRHSDRRLYDFEPLSDKEILAIKKSSLKNAFIEVFTERQSIDFLADKTYQVTLKAMSNPAFRNELSMWVRNNWTKQPDGMPAYTQGMPGPVSLAAKFLIRKAKPVPKDQAKKDSSRVKNSPAVGLVCVKSNEPASWLEAGRVYQSACLEATKLEIKTSGISAAVVDNACAEEITKKLKLDGIPVALIRFGRVNGSVKSTPRLAVSEFLLT